MNTIERITGIPLVKGDDVADVTEKFVTRLAGLVGVGAREERLDLNTSFVQHADQAGELILLRGTGFFRGREGDVDLVDMFRPAKSRSVSAACGAARTTGVFQTQRP